MSVIVGDDIICRLSLRSVHDIKARIIKVEYACELINLPRGLTVLPAFQELEQTKLPKYKILWNTSVNFLFDCINFKKSASEEQLLPNNNTEVLDNSFITTTSTEDTASYQQATTTAQENSQATNDILLNVDSLLQSAIEGYEELKLPGQILYIYRIKDYKRKKRCCKFDQTDSYDLRWADRDEFKNIIITKHMLIDHFPNRVEESLKFFYQFSENYL